MTEEERKTFDKESKDVEKKADKTIADQFRALVAELSEVLDKPQLKDTETGKILAQEKDDKSILEQAAAFKLDHLDVRSPEKKKASEEVYHSRHKERLDFLFDAKGTEDQLR